MSSTRCPFCEHGNAADAKFCSECGGALHLVPCPSCGAVNQVTASACYQCRRPLQGRGATAPAPSLPTDLSDLLPDSISGTVVPESLPVAVVRESLPRRRSQVIVGTVAVVVIAALGYNAYRQRSPQDEARPQAVSGASDPNAFTGVVRRDAAVGVSASPSGTGAGRASAAILPSGTSLAAPAPVVVDQPRTGRQPVESQKAKAAVPAAALPQAVSASRAGVPGGPIVHEACTEAGAALGLCVLSPARKKTPETAAAVSAASARAPATGSRRSGGQEPARPQECTEAVAALGLCPPGITQRRE
jgi:double zinc ribbon protein